MAFEDVELVAAAEGDSAAYEEVNSGAVSDKDEHSELVDCKSKDNCSISAQGGSRPAACANQSSTSNRDISGR